MYLQPRQYTLGNGTDCDCRVDLDCVTSAVIYDVFGVMSIGFYYDTQVLLSPPGILVGCFPVTAILLSTLECFYNQTCLDELIAFFPTSEQFTAMSAPKPSRFKPNATVKSIVNHLMVEGWAINISYEKYYAQCAPISCTYSQVEQHGIFSVLAKLISLLGGCRLFTFPIIQYTSEITLA